MKKLYDEKDVVKKSVKPFTPEQAKEVAKDFNGMVDEKKKRENEELRNIFKGEKPIIKK